MTFLKDTLLLAYARASRFIKLEVAFAGPDGDAVTLSTTVNMYSQFSDTSVSSVARATALSISLFTADRNILDGMKAEC
jgi:hypothetical protein